MNRNFLVLAIALAFATVASSQAATPPQVPVPVGSHHLSAPLSSAQRAALVAQIVQQWGPFVRLAERTSITAWAVRMQATFNAATDSNLIRAAGMKTFQGMVDALTGMQLTDKKIIEGLAVQAEALKSKPGPAMLGDVSDDLVYTPLSPCRIADTRNVGGPIGGGTSRDFHGYTLTDFSAQGGISGSNCGIPPNPSALVLDVTSVGSTQSGYLTLWPFGTTKPLADNLDYAVGTIADNEVAAIMTIGSSTDEFSVYANGNTNVVMDVVGYYMAPQATALNTTTVSEGDTLTPGQVLTVNLVCPAGLTPVSSGCFTNSNDGSDVIFGNGIVGGVPYCQYHNKAGTNDSVGSYLTCGQVPGR